MIIIIFHEDMCLGKNTSQPTNVLVVTLGPDNECAAVG